MNSIKTHIIVCFRLAITFVYTYIPKTMKHTKLKLILKVLRLFLIFLFTDLLPKIEGMYIQHFSHFYHQNDDIILVQKIY